MAKLNPATQRAEVSKFYQVLNIIIKSLLVPVILISLLSSFVFLTSKLNSNIPTLFGTSVVTLSEDVKITGVKDFKKGDRVGVVKVDITTIKEGDYVAYFQPVEVKPKNGSKVLIAKVTEIKLNPQDNKPMFGVRGEEVFVVGDGIIGKYQETSKFMVGVLKFFSNKNVLAFGCLLPLSVMLILYVVYVLELKNVDKINMAIDQGTYEAYLESEYKKKQAKLEDAEKKKKEKEEQKEKIKKEKKDKEKKPEKIKNKDKKDEKKEQDQKKEQGENKQLQEKKNEKKEEIEIKKEQGQENPANVPPRPMPNNLPPRPVADLPEKPTNQPKIEEKVKVEKTAEPKKVEEKLAKEEKPVKAEKTEKTEKAIDKPANQEKIVKEEKPAKVEPVKNEKAVKAETPEKLTKVEKTEAKVEKPVKPVKAEKPVKPAKAEKPVKPAKAEKPVKPEKPAKPAKVKPEKPVKTEKQGK